MTAGPADLPFERAFRRRCEAEAVEWETLRYPRGVEGEETRAHRFTPAAGASGGVLLVHGAGNDALFALPGMIEALLRKGLEVFTFDVDGHGRGSGTMLDADGAADCIEAALRAWGAAERGLPLHAVGVSFGGSLLLGALPGLGETLSSATLISAPLRVSVSWEVIRRELGFPMLRTLWRERRRVGVSGLVPSFGPFRRDVYPLRLRDTPGDGPFGYVEVLNRILESLQLEKAAERTRIPVLLAYGERDLLVPVEQGRRLAARIPASRLLTPPLETHLTTPLAPEVLSALEGWIGRHTPAPRLSA